MPSANTDRNLLYGVLALQMGFIERDALILAMQSWVMSKSKSLSQILRDQNAIERQDHPAVEYAVRRHLEKTEYDATQCLTSLDVELSGSVRELLRAIDDGDLQQTLRNVEAEESRRSRVELVETMAPSNSSSSDVIDLRSLLEADAPARQRYRVLKPHAKGGLGEVFLAYDEEVGRQVALKEIRREHAANETLRSRFVREAEVNGNLEHPGIVPVYGLGVYPDGRPYYAMRFVEGETLHAALTRFHLEAEANGHATSIVELRKLVRSMVDVCNAIAYAHGRGVLHRDLKPANILLGTYGETLIIDWGLAKVLDQADASSTRDGLQVEALHLPSSESSVISTVAGETMGSPPYMSPEQARGEHDTLDKASDIYNLGATFYAILTGRPPIVDKQVKTILNKVKTGDFPAPSLVNPRIPKELEAICLKAMSLEPKARYRTAHGLCDDLEHWLADQPVSVYRDPLSTKVLRWARLHRDLVASGVCLMIVGLSGLSIATAVINQQKREAVEARERETIARVAAEKSSEVAIKARGVASDHLAVGLDVIEQLVTVGDRQLITQQSTASRKQFLASAIDFIKRFQKSESNDGTLQARVASLARRLANLDRLTGDYQTADTLYDEAIEILEKLTRSDSAPPALRILLAETLLDQGQAWLEQGKAGDAAGLFARAGTLARDDADRRAGTIDFQRCFGKSLYLQGSAQLKAGDPEAANALRKAVEAMAPIADATLPDVRSKVTRNEPQSLFDQTQYVAALCQLGTALREQRQPKEAEAWHRKSLERMTALSREFNGLNLADVELCQAWVAARLAETLFEQSDVTTEADQLLNDAVARLRNLVQAQPEVPQFGEYLADSLMLRARGHARSGRFDDAMIDAKASRALIEPLVARNPSIPDFQGLLAHVLTVEADLATGRHSSTSDSPRTLYERALAAYDSALQSLPHNAELLRGRSNCLARLKAL